MPPAFPAPVPCFAYLALGRVARSLLSLALRSVARPPAGMPAFLSWLCVLWGGHKGARGVATCLRVGRPGWGALPRPTARPWGVRQGPATHWLWLRGVFPWGAVTNPIIRALASWLRALSRRQEGARGGGASFGCP